MLHIIQYILFVIAYFVELYHGIPNRTGVITLLIISIIYRFYYQTMKNLYYTFWTISFFIGIYLIFKIGILLSYPNVESAILIYFLTFILLCLECYFLISPIYYPRVNWWEYDFRYRADLKVHITSSTNQEHQIEARLSDVRRKAACVSSFEDLPIGETFTLCLPDNLSFEIEIMSQRQYSLGRPTIFGIKFLLHDEGERDQQELDKYKEFEHSFKDHKYEKKQMKFIKSENNEF